MVRRTVTRLLLLAALFVVSPAALSAQDERGFQAEVFGASVHLYDDGDEASDQSYGLRAAYRFASGWAIEAALSKIDDHDVDAYVGDVSAKLTFARLERFSVYALAGPGILRIRDEGFDVDEDTYHLGVGAEIPFAGKGYLRPEVRGRRYVDSNLDATLVDYSLGVGWKF